MRLIDKDKLIKKLSLSENCENCEFSEKKYFCKRGSDFVDVCEEVCDAPEIDFTKKIPFYSAKELNAERYQDGFYFAMPETTYCTTEDYERHPVKIHHFIINHRMSDWGLPNRTEGTEIDPNTLKFLGWFTVRESYGTESWVERDNNGN